MSRYHVKDVALAAEGSARIEWAQRRMPVLRAVRERFAAERPLAGVRIAACLPVTAETGVLVQALQAGGAFHRDGLAAIAAGRHLDIRAEGLQHLLAVIAGQRLLIDVGGATGIQRRKQQRRLNLGAGGLDLGADRRGIAGPVQGQRHQGLGPLPFMSDAEGQQRLHHPRHGARHE